MEKLEQLKAFRKINGGISLFSFRSELWCGTGQGQRQRSLEQNKNKNNLNSSLLIFAKGARAVQ